MLDGGSPHLSRGEAKGGTVASFLPSRSSGCKEADYATGSQSDVANQECFHESSKIATQGTLPNGVVRRLKILQALRGYFLDDHR